MRRVWGEVRSEIMFQQKSCSNSKFLIKRVDLRYCPWKKTWSNTKCKVYTRVSCNKCMSVWYTWAWLCPISCTTARGYLTFSQASIRRHYMYTTIQCLDLATAVGSNAFRNYTTRCPFAGIVFCGQPPWLKTWNSVGAFSTHLTWNAFQSVRNGWRYGGLDSTKPLLARIKRLDLHGFCGSSGGLVFDPVSE